MFAAALRGGSLAQFDVMHKVLLPLGSAWQAQAEPRGPPRPTAAALDRNVSVLDAESRATRDEYVARTNAAVSCRQNERARRSDTSLTANCLRARGCHHERLSLRHTELFAAHCTPNYHGADT